MVGPTQTSSLIDDWENLNVSVDHMQTEDSLLLDTLL